MIPERKLKIEDPDVYSFPDKTVVRPDFKIYESKEQPKKMVLINNGEKVFRFYMDSEKNAKDNKTGLINFLLKTDFSKVDVENFTVVDGKDILIFPGNKKELLEMKKAFEKNKEIEDKIKEQRKKILEEQQRLGEEELKLKSETQIKNLHDKVEYKSKVKSSALEKEEAIFREIHRLINSEDDKLKGEFVEFIYEDEKTKFPTNKGKLEKLWWESLLDYCSKELKQDMGAMSTVFSKDDYFDDIENVISKAKENANDYYDIPLKPQSLRVRNLLKTTNAIAENLKINPQK